jgi:hypothetical protein
MTITDHRQQRVCILPVGFHFDDQRWDRIWERYGEKGETLIHDDLRELFPDEPTLQYARPEADDSWVCRYQRACPSGYGACAPNPTYGNGIPPSPRIA